VLDEGILFRTNETAFVSTKRNLLESCNLWCIISLPAGTFVAAGGGVKANILFFTKGETTEKIWCYDLSDIKVGKRTPLTESHFDEFFRLLPTQGDSERSWTINITERKAIAEEKSAPFKQKAAVIEEEIRVSPQYIGERVIQAPMTNQRN
ncbi:MAG: N-6 DNA methylase, partial [Cuspidothrix sp.]